MIGNRGEGRTCAASGTSFLRGSRVALAVGIVIGVTFEVPGTQFVASFITPLLAAIGGKPEYGALQSTV